MKILNTLHFFNSSHFSLKICVQKLLLACLQKKVIIKSISTACHQKNIYRNQIVYKTQHRKILYKLFSWGKLNPNSGGIKLFFLQFGWVGVFLTHSVFICSIQTMHGCISLLKAKQLHIIAHIHFLGTWLDTCSCLIEFIPHLLIVIVYIWVLSSILFFCLHDDFLIMLIATFGNVCHWIHWLLSN